MPKLIHLLLKRQSMLKIYRGLVFCLLAISLLGSIKSAQAKTSKNAPVELKSLLTQIDNAASQRNINQVMKFYADNFTHKDGLNRGSLQQALTSFWKQYPNLKYTTEIKSWKTEANGIIAETVTNITAVPTNDQNSLKMDTTITSRQRIVNSKIVSQEILSEETQITSGVKPPEVEINLPDKLKVGEKYNFDAIVQEPLGDDYLLGAALEESIQPNKYLQPTSVDLELLSAGGLFKTGEAPSTPGNKWISAVLVRGNGMTMITRRIPVVRK